MKQRLQFLLAFLIVVTACTTPKTAMDNTSQGNEQIPKSFNPGKVTDIAGLRFLGKTRDGDQQDKDD